MKTTSFDVPKYLYHFVFGLPGSGKTTYAASAVLDERTAPVLWVDFAGNPESAYDLFAQHRDEVKVVQLDSPEESGQILDYLVKGQPENHPIAKQIGGVQYRTLVVDTFTEVNRRVMSKLLGVDRLGEIPLKSDSAEKNQIRYYDTMLSFNSAFAHGVFYRLNMHVIMTAQQAVSEWSSGVYPNLMGQGKTEVPAYAKLVSLLMHRTQCDDLSTILKLPEYAQIKPNEVYNVMQLKPSKNVPLLKTSYGMEVNARVPQYIFNPTVTTILNLFGIQSQTQTKGV